MAARRYNSIVMPLLNGVLVIADNKVDRPLEGVLADTILPSEWKGAPAVDGLLSFDPDASAAGMCSLSLYELKEYYWEFRFTSSQSGVPPIITSSLANVPSKARWNPKFSNEHTSGTFYVQSYLGSAWIEVSVERIRFDVVTAKLDYATEYRWMVEAIAERCQQLLLEWDSPTSLPVRAEPEQSSRILLEKFLFLRHVLGPDKLDLYLEILFHRPHSALFRQRQWQPAGTARADLYLRDPLRFGRGFSVAAGAIMAVPDEVMEERKFDSLDTPPNRFVRFALESFSEVCDQVLGCSRMEYGTAYNEAAAMRELLCGFLGSDLFADVGALRRIPYESQVLQKREGYRQILQAWLMLDAAAQIDWLGREDVYDGQSRDVPTLYEYWLYFQLFDLFKSISGIQLIHHEGVIEMGPREAFGKDTDGRLVINLKQGESSFTLFRWTGIDGQSLRLHLFYNREFAPRPGDLDGSYTETFRPDFSVVIIPGDLNGSWDECEKLAAQSERIAYLHLDAKYRVEKLSELFKSSHSEAERRTEKATNTFKNADLYKMHTYNEAIRRTVGSYVLYPGIAGQEDDKNRFKRYHEILPGVGAFALKPEADGQAVGRNALAAFISDVLIHQASRFTQHYRINYWTNEAVREAPVVSGVGESPESPVPPADATIISGYMRLGACEICREKEIFYFHAVAEDGTPQKFDPAVLKAQYFIPFAGNNRARNWLGWYATIDKCELIAKKDLLVLIPAAVVESRRAYYFLVRFKQGSIRDFWKLPGAKPPKPGLPVPGRWLDLLK